jgi:exosortase
LILGVCGWLVIRSRRAIAAAPAHRPPLWLPVALVIVVFAWLVCYRASIEGLAVPLVPAIFWLAVTVAFGWRVGRLLAFPVLFFYFAVPIWYGTPLKDLTVLVMHCVLYITGPQASFSGDFIHIPNGTFVIEEGCSGVHFMIVGLAVAALHGELRQDSGRTRLAFLALMAGLALLANWVRVYTIVEAGYLTNMQSYLVRVSHYGFGWCVFAVAMVLFFWLTARFGPPETSLPATDAPRPIEARRTGSELAGFVLALAVVVAVPAVSAGLRLLHPLPALPGGSLVATGATTWTAVPANQNSYWQPVVKGADELQRLAFVDAGGDEIEVFSAAIVVQRQGAKLVGETSSLLGDGLQAVAVSRADTPVGAFRDTEAIDQTNVASVLWWRYEAAGGKFVSGAAAQLWYGVVATVSRPSARVVVLRAVCRSGCDNARHALRAFVESGTVVRAGGTAQTAQSRRYVTYRGALRHPV